MRLTVGAVAMLLVGTARGKTSGPNHYTPEQIALVRGGYRTDEAVGKHVRDLRGRVEYAMAMSDAELWRFVPPADLVRATFLWRGQGNFPGCPVCGKKTFRVGGGFYPWSFSRDNPWKVTCPSCKTVFPSNDFGSYYANDFQGECDMSGEYPDDGTGWVSPSGLRHYFVGHWCQKQRWRDILRLIEDLGELYLVTEEQRYARVCALLLCRFAAVYPDTQYDKQSNYGAQGRVLPWCWENTSVVKPLAIAYDSVWPYMREMRDEGLKAFLASKGIPDWCVHVDSGFLQDVAEKMIHTNQYLSNEGDHQRAFAIVALVWGDNDPARGITTGQMLQWLVTGRGNMECLVWNDIYADGFPNESSPGYSSAVSVKAWEIARYMARAGYDLFKSPRMAATAHVWLDLTICGRQQPAIGDYGSIFGGGRAGWDASMLRWAWEQYRDARFAKALMDIGNPAAGLYAPDTRAEIVEAAKAHPGPVVRGTRNLSQFGCAILESPSLSRMRGLSLYYGSAAGGHGHYDRLNIELYANGRSMMPDLGYPDQWGAKATHFHKNSTAHYVVHIDEMGQQTMSRGRLHYIADLEAVQVVEASAERAYPGLAETYRRTTALVDTSPEDFYVVDIFRVRGGTTHDWLFHGPPLPGFETDGLALSEPRKGTLAGAELEVGEQPPGSGRSGYEWLHSVREGSPEADWTVTYPPAGAKAGLRMTMLPGCARRVFVAHVASPQLKRAGLPATLPWLIARNETEGMSTYVAVIRTLQDADCVEAIEPVLVQSRDDTGVALRVGTADYVDTIYSSLDPDAQAGLGTGVAVAGRFVLIRRKRNGSVVSVHSVGANSIAGHGFVLAANGELRGAVAAVDAATNTVTVDGFPASEGLAGQSVLFSNDLHQTNFQVSAVSGAGSKAVLDFGYVSVIAGRGEVFEVNDATRTILTDTLWRTHGTMDIWTRGFHPALEGMALVNALYSWSSRIESCRLFPDLPKEWWQPEADHGSFRVAPAGKLSDVFGKGDPYFVHAVAPGDAACLPTSLVLQAVGTRSRRLRTTSDRLSLTMPGMPDTAVYKSIGGRSAASAVKAEDGAFSFGSEQLASGEGMLILTPDPGVDYADSEPPQLAAMTVDGRRVAYEPGMGLPGPGSGRLGLMFSDANPMLPLDIRLAGSPVSRDAAGVEVRTVDTRHIALSLDVGLLARTVSAPELDYPPVLSVSVRDAALNPEPCTVSFVVPSVAEPGAEAVFLSDLDLVRGLAHGGVKRDADYYGEPGFDLNGRHFDKGIMTCPRADGSAEAVYDISGLSASGTFKAVIGVEDQTGTRGSVTFEVHVDEGAGGWKLLYSSDVIRGGGAVKAISVALGQAERLRVVCTDAADSHNSDHATWANGRLEKGGQVGQSPR